ncbi:Hypothetical_protein [Hexamita inflata]|uniref:Hypothetical_protein n=1 Tax=Hexamita inflata TaxID=28002 RepID=A0AA86NBZ9_9EUKA|nr:Hypothetical protein HINF_LOCUS4073 [Hexamita inflata]
MDIYLQSCLQLQDWICLQTVSIISRKTHYSCRKGTLNVKYMYQKFSIYIFDDLQCIIKIQHKWNPEVINEDSLIRFDWQQQYIFNCNFNLLKQVELQLLKQRNKDLVQL